jgi:hypothetical protein
MIMCQTEPEMTPKDTRSRQPVKIQGYAGSPLDKVQAALATIDTQY